jgi:hypothetical protein
LSFPSAQRRELRFKTSPEMLDAEHRQRFGAGNPATEEARDDGQLVQRLSEPSRRHGYDGREVLLRIDGRYGDFVDQLGSARA